jgi:ABC-type multidrug transport system ATPase subunit
MQTILALQAVSKTYRSGFIHPRIVHALRNVSFSLARGETLVILGPPGAGKTTLARAIMGQITPDEGWIRRFPDPDIPGDGTSRIGYKPEMFSPFSRQPCGRLIARALRGSRRGAGGPGRTALEVLEALDLRAYLGVPARHLPRGVAARLGLGLALIPGPDLAVLDNPSPDLDADGRGVLRRILDERRRTGASTLVTAHELTEVESIADRVLVLTGGMVQRTGRPQEIVPPETAFTVAVSEDPLLAPGWRFLRAGDQWYSTVDGRSQLDLLLRALQVRGIAPAVVSPVRCSLTSLFSRMA